LCEIKSGSLTKSYIYSNNGQILCQRDGGQSADEYFYVNDRLGSVRQVIDNGGIVVRNYTYSPFGQLLESGAKVGAPSNPFVFTGQWFDSEIAQYYLRARMYDPQLMRFTSRDPVRGKFNHPMSLHVYLYCLNDPVNWIDPTGESRLVELMTSAKVWAMGVASSGMGHLQQALGWARRVIQQVSQANLIRSVMYRGQAIWTKGNVQLMRAYNALFGRGITGRAAHTGSRAYGANQRALIELAKNAKRSGGVAAKEAKILLEWASEYGVSSRGPQIHPNAATVNYWHVHIGKVSHIRITDMW
jgi:RHS repeat-associated protein